MLHADAPGLGPHFCEHLHHAGRSQRDAIWPDMTKRIVSIRLRRVGSIKVDDIQQPFRWNAIGDPLDQVAMRIDQREAVAALQVLKCHSLDQRRFAGAGLADDVDVRKPILSFYAEQLLTIPKIRSGEIRDIVRLGHSATIRSRDAPHDAIVCRDG